MTTLSTDHLSLLSPLGRAFLLTLRSGALQTAFLEDFSDRLAVSIPAAHPAIGDLVILDDSEELTVIVGSHTHCHFALNTVPRRDGELPQDAVVRHSLEFLKSVLADRTVVWSTPSGSGGTFNIDSPRQPKPAGSQAWVWSGQRYLWPPG